MIKRFYTKDITTSRQTWVADKSTLSEVETFKGHLQQGTPDEYRENLGFSFTKAFTIWCSPDTDIQEGDKVVINSNNYDVRFVIDRNIGTDGHFEVIIEKNG